MTTTADEEAPAQPVPVPADEEQPRRWHLRAAAGAAVIIGATALVHGLGGHGALLTGGIIGAAVLIGLVIWRLPHLRRHFARPRGIRPWKSSRTQPWQAGKRAGFLPSLRRGSRTGHGLNFGANRPAARRSAAAPLAGRPAPRGIRGKLPSWVPGSARRGGTQNGSGKTASKPRGLARVVPAPVRKALGRLHKPGSVAAQRKAAQAKAARATASKPGRKPDASPARKTPARRGAKCARCGKPAQSEVTWADGLNTGTELLCDDCWDKGTKAARAAKGLTESEPAPEPERQPGVPIEPAKTGTPTKARSRTMSAAGIAAEAVHEQIGGYEPESGTDLDLFLGDLGPLYEELGAAMGHLADRLGSEFPVHPSVIEHLHEIAATTAGLSEFAAEAHAIHRVAHKKELERIEEPRPNEGLWDVTQQ